MPKLIELVRKFDSGVIELPLMQRDYQWPPKKVVDLLDSIYKGWPIGVFYIWKTPNIQITRSAAVRRVGSKIAEPFEGYLLDGQQRLTSLSKALEMEDADNLETRAFFDIRKEIFVMGTRTKTIQKRIMNDDPTLIALSKLIPKYIASESEYKKQTERMFKDILDKLIEQHIIGNTTDALAEYRSKLDSVARMLDGEALWELFKTGDTDKDLDNAILLFKRLNKGGKTLSRGDAEAATLTHRATASIVPKMRQIVQDDHQRRLGLNFVFAARALITVHRDSSRLSKLPTGWALSGEIKESWKVTDRSLRQVVKFLREELGWTTRRWLPSANALIPLVYLLSRRHNGFADKEQADVRRYLFLTGIRGLFRGTVETTIDSYIKPVRTAAKPTQCRAALLVKTIAKYQQRRIKADDILNARSMYSPLMQVYLAYLVSKDARTWLEETPLLEVAKRDISDPLAVHHIFPRELMRDHAEPERINCMANYAILSQADNAQIGKEDPQVVYDGLSGKAKDYADEQLFFIFTEKREWIQAYDAFLQKRAEMLAERLNSFIKLG
jgi:hypothetical protein